MRVNRIFLVASVAVISAVAVSSCAYDPHYSGSSYSTGYGSGYGYGGRNFTTTYFVSTGSPRWGYDPYARCYYDYSRRSYYDPYLYGYYPVGYRPRYVYGAPHPHGWRSGHTHIAPPSRIRDSRLDNYHNRTERYRSLSHPWSRNVQVNSRTREVESHLTQQASNDRILESRKQSSFGSRQLNQNSRTTDRSARTYHGSQNSGRPDPRMVQPRQESPRFSGQQQTNRNDRATRSNLHVESNEVQGESRNNFVKPEIRQQENRAGGRARPAETREREHPANRRSSESSVDERVARQR